VLAWWTSAEVGIVVCEGTNPGLRAWARVRAGAGEQALTLVHFD
jgi:hypothetical protein